MIFIGGTSHVGKSRLGEALATNLGWQLLSTDQFARHPGRPWRDDDTDVPTHVVNYFSSYGDTQLLEDVLRHYQDNVWPITRAIVSSRLNNPFDVPLVIEGSSILPEQLSEISSNEVHALWLLGDEMLLVERIRKESGYQRRNDADRLLIDTFIRRTLAFDTKLRESLQNEGLQSIHFSAEVSVQELVGNLKNNLRMTKEV